jgi:hypothetical protein
MAVALQLLTVSDFQSHLNENFLIHFSRGVVGTAQLQNVVALPDLPNMERKPFSILLQTEQNSREYQQGIYTIEHPEFGAMDIFLVPVGCNSKGLQYEAVFS